jgi:glycosyltransferase involved in cell wall biosynthesis
VEATANLLAELCEALVDDYDVTVVTGRLRPYPELPHDEMVNGVRVIRVRSTAFDRTGIYQRAVNYFTYLAESLLRAITLERPDAVVTLTDPPMIGDIGLAVSRRFGVPLLVVSEDVFPEIAVELGRLRNPVLVKLLGTLVNLYLRRADRLVAIGDTMRVRLQEKGAASERISVIENWVDTTRITPQPRDNPWAQEHGLADSFVVMHSGNIGHANDLVTLVRAATFLRDLEDLQIVVIGFGALQTVVTELAERLGADVRFLPFQPREVLSESLSSAHIHYVGLARGLSGFVVPSRAYGIMSAGRPLLVSADPDSETVRIVHDNDCGIVVPPGRPELVAGAIRDAYEGRFDLDAMGQRGRAFAVRHADRSVALQHYRRLLEELVHTTSTGSRWRQAAELRR